MTTEQMTMNKTTSTAESNSGLQSCKKVSGENKEIKFVPVAKFRQAYDHLLRVVNSDYHACVDAKELSNWKEIAERVIDEVTNTDCKRATAVDREWQQRAIRLAKVQIENAVKRIFVLKERAEKIRLATQIRKV